jgi:hypothetical protein
MAHQEHLAIIEEQVTTLLKRKWVTLTAACADRELRYPGVYLLAWSPRPLRGKRVKVEDVIYIGMSTASNGVQGRLQSFRGGVETNTRHSGAERFYEVFAGNQPYSKLNTKNCFYAATLVIPCEERQTPSDWRSMGHVRCLEYYVLARVLQKMRKLPRLNLPKPPRRVGHEDRP